MFGTTKFGGLMVIIFTPGGVLKTKGVSKVRTPLPKCVKNFG